MARDFIKALDIDQTTTSPNTRHKYRTQKKQYSGDHYPNTQMDWGTLRVAKQKCETCESFHQMLGGCKLNLLPDMICMLFKERKLK